MKAMSIKEILREIKSSSGRFLSLFFIVAISVAFFVGVNASVPIMKTSADKYFDDYNMMDIKVVSTLGLTQDDISAISNIDGVEGVFGAKTYDALHIDQKNQNVYRLLSFDQNLENNDVNNLNKPRLMQGRMPKEENEIVVEQKIIQTNGNKNAQIGDKISFTSGDDVPLSKSLKIDEFTVVGLVQSPVYMTLTKGESKIGSGVIDTYAFLNDSVFLQKELSEIYIRVKGANVVNTFSEDYFDIIKPVQNSLESIGIAQSEIRLQSIKNEAQAKIDEGYVEIEKKNKELQSGLGEAREKINSSEKQLNEAISRFENEKKQANEQLVNSKVQLKQAQEGLLTLNTNKEMLKQNLIVLKSTREEKLSQLDLSIQNYQNQNKSIQERIDQGVINPEELASLNELLKANNEAIQLLNTTKANSIVAFENQKNELNNQINIIQSKIIEVTTLISSSQKALEEGEKAATSKLDLAGIELDKAKQEIEKAKIELAKSESEGTEKILEGKAELKSSSSSIDNIEQGKWFVLDRTMQEAYAKYEQSANQMSNIAIVFPVFFFLVAALVCLTTMTRMVDEQRLEIGTMKALGYGQMFIASKYLVYAGVASMTGGIFGAIIGMYLFPTVIYNAWSIEYALPAVTIQFQYGISVVAIILNSAVTLTATYFACKNELRDVPSQLMRPKAPKKGKRILLERIKHVWKHLSFMHKVTARNVFRYKKRFLMTIIGISGCSALLLAGFGIQDSIGTIVTKQYEEIFKYHATLKYKSDSSEEDIKKHIEIMATNPNVDICEPIAQIRGKTILDDNESSVSIFVVSDENALKQFIDIRNLNTKKPIDIPEDSVIIDLRLSEILGKGVGDKLIIKNENDQQREVVVGGINENYVSHIIYMSDNYYEKVFNEKAKSQHLLIKMKDYNTNNETLLGKEVLENDNVDSISYYSGLKESFSNTIESLTIVVFVLVVSAGCLAFVVLYNLSSVNISERTREIATIKVLGFYDNEVSKYVNRETILLTIIGGAAGLILGIGLHRLIIQTVEMENIMFGRNIVWISFVISFVITIIFALIVNLVMRRRLKKIPMVESLKSVE